MNIENKRILVTGSSGFLGTHVVNELRLQGVKEKQIRHSPHFKFDLRKKSACRKAVAGCDIVIHLAGNVGGIQYNKSNPAKLFWDNLMMGVQIIHASFLNCVEKVVIIGTICSYPKFTPVPFREEDLWNGYPEPTNAPYGIAKKALLVQLNAYRAQYGLNGIYLLPVNLYGPGDNFNPDSSHVIPALIRKFTEAVKSGLSEVEVWGTGNATREFLYVKDAARAIVLATDLYNGSEAVNIGAGMEISIKALAEKIAGITGYQGKIVWNSNKPDGQPRRSLDVSRARKEFGFVAQTDFDTGLRTTIQWYQSL
jgi:GDP-L-fucose synthase